MAIFCPKYVIIILKSKKNNYLKGSIESNQNLRFLIFIILEIVNFKFQQF